MNQPSSAISCEIRVCPPEQRTRAVWLVFSDLPPEERNSQISNLLTTIRAGEADWNGLWAAVRNGQLVGAIWSYLMQGRQAIIWPPQIVDGESPETLDSLLRILLENLRQREVQMVLSVLPTDQNIQPAALVRGEFQSLNDLLLLVADAGEFPAAAPPCPFEFKKHSVSDDQRLSQLIEETYQGTLDCPDFNGLRTMEDVIAGYVGTGTSRASHWFLIRQDGRDLGCLILADHAEQHQWELVYMGLVPAARGQGWGKKIVAYAQWLAKQNETQQMFLAVDEKNRPALDMYTAAGFAVWGKRAVWFKKL